MSNSRRPWSPSDSDTLKRMASSGYSDAEIARHMNRDVKMVGKKRRGMNIDRGISDAMVRALRRVNARRTVAVNTRLSTSEWRRLNGDTDAST